jgi:hypothetical protein
MPWSDNTSAFCIPLCQSWPTKFLKALHSLCFIESTFFALFRNLSIRVSISKGSSFSTSLQCAFMLSLAVVLPAGPLPSRILPALSRIRMMRPDREAAPRLGFVRLCLYFRERLAWRGINFTDLFLFAGLDARSLVTCGWFWMTKSLSPWFLQRLYNGWADSLPSQKKRNYSF